MNVGLFLDNHFNFFSTKAKINKSEPNLINLDGLKATGFLTNCRASQDLGS